MKNVFLANDKVSLCYLGDEDFEGSYVVGINSQDYDLFTEHAMRPKSVADLKRYAEQKKANGDLWFGIFNNGSGKHVGNIELSSICPVHEKAVYAIVLWADHGQGLAFEASRLLLSFAFAKRNLHRVELYVHEKNEAAIALYKKLGFVLEGVQREAFRREGKRYGLNIMGLLSHEFKHAP